MRRIVLILCLTWHLQALGATPRVPASMSLADIQLKLTATARKRVQEKVDSLTRSEKHLQALLDRVNLFFPIVERVLQEEGIPQDFKYQVIQESGMVSDAVHASNSVGFWQFKEPAALEVGLKISPVIDERMHITVATQGAARYLKSHNQSFDNWLYTLLAYNRGRGYVERNTVCKKFRGVKKMRIDRKTHWYIIHFLAHKLVFEDKVGKDRHPELYLYEYKEAHDKTLREIAQEFEVDKERLKEHNKWLKRHRVPRDTTYATIIPLTHEQYAQWQTPKSHRPTAVVSRPSRINYRERTATFPVITTRDVRGQMHTLINGIRGAVAQVEDSIETLAQAGHISVKQLLAINDMTQGDLIVPGQVYYFKAKRSKAGTHFHIVRPGETWWSVAQQYGITKRQLLLKNRLRQEVELQPRRVLWLRFIRPPHIPAAYEDPL